MPFVYSRVIRFHETDAAGVVYFANLLTLCHEAYEAALAAADIDLQVFFSDADETAVPIIHTEADFYQALRCGDAISVVVKPKQLSPHSFEVAYAIWGQSAVAESAEKPLVSALTRHVCINVHSRRRHALTPALVDWIDAVNASADPDD